MDLPLSYTNELEDDETGITFEYVINTNNEKPLSVLLNDHLFIPFKVYLSGILIDYQLQIFDIREPMHNTLVLKYNYTRVDEIKIDEKFVNMNVVQIRRQPEDLYAVIVNVNESR